MNDKEPDGRPQATVKPRAGGLGKPMPAGTESASLQRNSLSGTNVFISVLAHELRNLIAPVRNVATMMRMRNATELDTRSLSDLIERQVNAIVMIFDGLTDADRLSRGDVTLDWEQVDAASVVEDAVGAARALLERRNQLLHLSPPAVRISLRADRSRLLHAIRCVIDNCSANTPSGGQLWVEAAAAGDEFHLTVRDNGIGIAQVDLPGIFNFFSIEDRQERPWNPGLEMGLAVARSLIELHQGRISVTSGGPGSGRDFLICIPLRASAEAAQSAHTTVAANPVRVEPALAAGAASRRVLIADDNAELRVSLSAVLQDMGHLTRVAAGGDEALQIAREWPPDFVLVDINMPGINGFELARMLRSEFPRSPMKLVMMSGDAMNDIALRGAKSAGFDQCIDKLSPAPVFEGILRGDQHSVKS